MARTSFFSRTKKIRILPVLPSWASRRMSSKYPVFQSAIKSRSSAFTSYASPGRVKIVAISVDDGIRRLPRNSIPSTNSRFGLATWASPFGPGFAGAAGVGVVSCGVVNWGVVSWVSRVRVAPVLLALVREQAVSADFAVSPDSAGFGPGQVEQAASPGTAEKSSGPGARTQPSRESELRQPTAPKPTDPALYPYLSKASRNSLSSAP